MAIEKKGKYIRMSDEVEKLLIALGESKNQTQTQVIETAIRLLAKKEKITFPAAHPPVS